MSGAIKAHKALCVVLKGCIGKCLSCVPVALILKQEVTWGQCYVQVVAHCREIHKTK